MAKQERPVQQTQSRDMTRATAPRGYSTVRSAGCPTGLLIAPGDLFRVGPFALMRTMSEKMDRVMEEFENGVVEVTVPVPRETSGKAACQDARYPDDTWRRTL